MAERKFNQTQMTWRKEREAEYRGPHRCKYTYIYVSSQPGYQTLLQASHSSDPSSYKETEVGNYASNTLNC